MVYFPVPVCSTTSGYPDVQIQIERTYANIKSPLSSRVLSAGEAKPWYADGTFNNPDCTLSSENPAEYTDTTGGNNNGPGFLETISLESIPAYHKRELDFLKSGQLPYSGRFLPK